MVALLSLALAPDAVAAEARLPEFTAQARPGDLVPGADRFGPPEGTPPLVAAYQADKLVGYVYLNTDYVGANGYSGKPIRFLVGIDTGGTVVGAKIVEHHEPIVLVGIPQSRIEAFLAGYVGYNPLREAHEARERDTADRRRERTEEHDESRRRPHSGRDRRDGLPLVDIVSGATVTVLVIGDSLTRSANRVARRIVGAPEQPEAERAPRRMDATAGQVADWQTLLGDGSVRRLRLSVGDVNEAFADDPEAASRPEKGDPGEIFIDLYVALVSHPAIGRSLLGESEFARLADALKPDQHAILVGAEGRYSFKGSGYVRGGVFDRIEVVQGQETIRFRDRDHRRIGALAAEGAPALRELDVFIVPRETDFNGAEPWTLKLLVQRPTGALTKAFRIFHLDYRLPDAYVRVEKAEERPAAAAAPSAPEGALAQLLAGLTGESDVEMSLWLRIWHSKAASIGALVAMIVVLTGIFFFQDVLVKRPALFDRIRIAYLIVTLVWLGWVAQAQLSVVNVLVFVGALRNDFQWSTFLADPLIFILWFSVAAALLFWGRGPFCGWLCPFGALQELTNRLGRLARLPQIRVPWGLHERLWPFKYMIFIVLFGVSLGSIGLAERLAEVEPFKTAIVLRFMREWWFVAFAVALLVAGLFVERFFCRYLCPLGAALAIPGRMRMFDWLKRYRECGHPCMRCYNDCPVQAIHPEGHINPNECISCLNCQVLYHDDRRCPVVIQRRLRHERREALASPHPRPGDPGQTHRAAAGGAQPSKASASTAPIDQMID